MKQSVETLKSYFETGDIPTEAQFANLIDSLSMPMIGEIKTVSFATVPSGWAKCDGQFLTISEYGTLYSLIGTTYGGDGTTTFALPNVQGKTMIHNDQTYNLGQTDGTTQNTLTESQIPTHSHDVGSLAVSHTLTGTVRGSEDAGNSDEVGTNHFASGIADSFTSSIVDMTLMKADNVQINGNIYKLGDL